MDGVQRSRVGHRLCSYQYPVPVPPHLQRGPVIVNVKVTEDLLSYNQRKTSKVRFWGMIFSRGSNVLEVATVVIKVAYYTRAIVLTQLRHVPAAIYRSMESEIETDWRRVYPWCSSQARTISRTVNIVSEDDPAVESTSSRGGKAKVHAFIRHG